MLPLLAFLPQSDFHWSHTQQGHVKLQSYPQMDQMHVQMNVFIPSWPITKAMRLCPVSECAQWEWTVLLFSVITLPQILKPLLLISQRHSNTFLDFLSAVCEFWPNSLCRRDAKRVQSSSYLATALSLSPLCNIGAWYSLINPHHLSTTRSRTLFTHSVLCLKPLSEWQMSVAWFLSQGSVDLFVRVSHALVLSAGFYHWQQ